MRRMKRRLIMLLLVLALMILHVTTVVPAEEPSVKTETDAAEEKKAEEIKEEIEDQTPSEDKKAGEKKAEEDKEEKAEGQTPAEETKEEAKTEKKKAEEAKGEGAEGQTPAEEIKEETKTEEKKAEEDKEEEAEGQTPAEETKEETKTEEKKAEEQKDTEAEKGASKGQTVTRPAANAAKDVWIDNTVDNSVAYIYSVIKDMDEATGQGGSTYTFKEQIPVSFSDSRPQAVEDAINAVKEELQQTAKERGYKNYSIYEDSSTVKVWDNRKYETIEEDDAVLIGDSGNYTGTPGGNITKTHVASGDYGKKTSYFVVLDVVFNHAYNITVKTSGKGTVTVEPESAAEGTTVSVKYKADQGYRLSGALVRNDSIEGVDGQISAVVYGESGTTEDSLSFRMPASDVTVSVYFEVIPHDHELVKTEEVKASCEEEGTEAYWTCSVCGKTFSDDKGSTEIEKPVKIPATGHSWNEWVVTREPTEDEAGEKTRTCKNDPNHKETVSIPPLEKEKEADQTVKDDENKKDDQDKKEIAPGNNKKNDGASSGKTSSARSKKSSKKSTSKVKSPKTGDRTDAFFLTFMAMASLAGVISAALARRNREGRG